MKRFIPYLLLSPLYGILALFLYWFSMSFFIPEIIYPKDWYPKVIAAGTDLSIVYNVVWTRSCTYSITRTLYNQETGNITIISFLQVPFKEGKDPDFESKITIPPSIRDGKYELRIIVQPNCNLYDVILPWSFNIKPMEITVDNTPVKFIKIEVLNNNLKVGEPLKVLSTVDRRRFCTPTVTTFVVDSDNTIVAKFTRPGAAATIGYNEIKEELPLTLPPGKYTLKRTIQSACAEKGYLTVYSDRDFEIEK
jgi:hypothetical protein